ncbi:uncharacterized protein MONBRDRAFT_34125 [Monosiga brevicollis MX1]|uniref:Uncharacterized protein n=1 Tax=Monosiga brevicollis TaxID=81824 RepID=A9V9Q6_MONBE|nr:uncharacterized protein MONBRDRAFT_34125 [Monosiga brevicollis MX1]EDQ85764.1 predicted protein [Monosiga brevicollis MX1]|eukprot:XP_001749479.1 hypothetical protein [Monosiga brevicollis MX1]
MGFLTQAAFQRLSVLVLFLVLGLVHSAAAVVSKEDGEALLASNKPTRFLATQRRPPDVLEPDRLQLLIERDWALYKKQLQEANRALDADSFAWGTGEDLEAKLLGITSKIKDTWEQDFLTAITQRIEDKLGAWKTQRAAAVLAAQNQAMEDTNIAAEQVKRNGTNLMDNCTLSKTKTMATANECMAHLNQVLLDWHSHFTNTTVPNWSSIEKNVEAHFSNLWSNLRNNVLRTLGSAPAPSSMTIPTDKENILWIKVSVQMDGRPRDPLLRRIRQHVIFAHGLTTRPIVEQNAQLPKTTNGMQPLFVLGDFSDGSISFGCKVSYNAATMEFGVLHRCLNVESHLRCNMYNFQLEIQPNQLFNKSSELALSELIPLATL